MWTQNYENIKWVQGASGKTKIVKCRFQDLDDAGTTPEDENSIEGAGGGRGCSPPACGEEPPAAAAAAAAAACPNPPERRGERDRRLEADAD